MSGTSMVWHRQAHIGGGSFGTVEKWINSETGEAVALKIPKFISAGTVEKRWNDEIEQLKVLSHPNVVGTRLLPEQVVAQVASRGPVLCMEYCGGGSLRDQLRVPANRCGLPPRTVLDVLRDVGAGVEYLHAQKIMHRDLKPENIVLQHRTGESAGGASDCKDPDNCLPGVTYKLIDLGYAKNLRETSMAASFVGTQVYLPPEMFIADCSYSYSAEYWSLGTLVFECITGRRPFFFNTNNLGIVHWYEQLRKKEEKHIYGLMESGGGNVSATFQSTLPDICSVREPYKHALETWLRSVLQFNAKKRGGYRKAGSKAECFELLDQILSMKVVNVFYIQTCTTFSYAIDELDNSTARLQEALAADSKVPVSEQVILSAIGQNVADYSAISRSVQDMSATNCWLFLIPTEQTFSLPTIRPTVRGLVHIVLQDPTALLSRDKRKQAYEESIFLAHQMFRASQRLMQSQRASILGVMRVSLRLEQTTKAFVEDARRVTYGSGFMRRNACDHLLQLRAVSGRLPPYLEQASAVLEGEFVAQVSALSEWEATDYALDEHQRVLLDVRERVRQLQRHNAMTLRQCDTELETHVKEAEHLFKELQGESDSGSATTQPMYKLLNACLLDFKRIAQSMFEHSYDMVSCYRLCTDRLAVQESPTAEIGGRLKELERMRLTQMQLWSLVQQLADGGPPSHSAPPLSAILAMPSSEVYHRQVVDLPSPTATGTGTVGAGMPSASRNSGTVRTLTNFLNHTVIMESAGSSSDNILRESQALFDRFSGNAAGPAGQPR